MREKAREKYDAIHSEYLEALRYVSSTHAVGSAVNPKHLQEVLKGMVGGAMSCVAAVASPFSATVLLGQDAGVLLNDVVLPATNRTLRAIQSGLDSLVSTRLPMLTYMVSEGDGPGVAPNAKRRWRP